MRQSEILAVPYVFNYSIERIWDTITNIETHASFYKDWLEYLIPIKGKSYKELGTTIEFCWKGRFTVELIVKEVVDTPYYKRVQLYSQKIDPLDFKYSITYHMHWNTLEKTTLFIHELKFDDEQAMTNINAELNYKDKMTLFKYIDEYLGRSTKDLKQSESIIIDRKMEKVWKIITNWNLLRKYVPSFADTVVYEGDPLDIGTKMHVYKKGVENHLLVVKSEVSEEKCEYVLRCFKGVPNAPKQDIQFLLAKAGNMTFLVFNQNFLQPIKHNMLNDMTKDKKFILMELKNKLERRRV